MPPFESLDRSAASLPTDPGVYLFKDRRGRVLYVGKAKNLRARVRQYLSGHDERPMVRFLVRAAYDVEVVVVRTEKEALILENTLIKKHRPRYNVKLVDDANFLHLYIDPAAPWPRWELVRRIQPGSGRYFGPFASASRARMTLDFLNRRFPLRTCSDRELQSRKRPCLLFQMGRCAGPCAELVSRDDYDRLVQESILFLEGRNTELIRRLKARMGELAEAERFEEAAGVRDLLSALQASIERQHVVDRKLGSADAWGMVRDGDRGVVALMPVRRGMMHEAVLLPFSGLLGEDGEVLSSVLNHWYDEGTPVPREVLLGVRPDDAAALTELLAERRGAAVRLHVPERGEKRRWVELAVTNARTAFKRQQSDDERRRKALHELQRVCHLPRLPRRIECFDNSNIAGTDPVAAMVVSIDGRPDPTRYRRFKVKTTVGADDFATMREILGRRFRRAATATDPGFGELPDLVVVDGGKGQVSAARAVLEELGFTDIPLIGLAKPRTERARGDRDSTDKIVLPGIRDPIRLPRHSGALRLLQELRDESHKTAVRYHRKVRQRRNLQSVIETLPGIGPTRRRTLLRAFGSAQGVREATETEIAALPGFGPVLARKVKEALGTP